MHCLSQLNHVQVIQPRSKPNFNRRKLQSTCKPVIFNPKKKVFLTRRTTLVLAQGNLPSSDNNDQDQVIFETASKLFSAFMTGNLDDLSEVVTNELKNSKDFTNLLPFLYLFNGEKIIIELVSAILAALVRHGEIVIRPKCGEQEPELCMKCLVEWKGFNIPLGQHYSIQVTHGYQGKVFLRHGNDIVDPMNYWEPIKKKLLAFLDSVLDKVAPNLKGKDKTVLMYCLLSLLSTFVTLILWKKTIV